MPQTRTFTDPQLCAAIVGRLTFGGDIIKTPRLRRRPTVGGLPGRGGRD
ncbi:hypothetical protein [Streptomyces sp. NPDC058473]